MTRIVAGECFFTKYVIDNMFNWLAKELAKSGFDCETAIHAIWKDDDASKSGRWDAQIFRFLLEKKYRLTPREGGTVNDYCIITADKDLHRYCREFGVDCIFTPQETPPTATGNKELAANLVLELEKRTQRSKTSSQSC